MGIFSESPTRSDSQSYSGLLLTDILFIKNNQPFGTFDIGIVFIEVDQKREKGGRGFAKIPFIFPDAHCLLNINQRKSSKLDSEENSLSAYVLSSLHKF